MTPWSAAATLVLVLSASPSDRLTREEIGRLPPAEQRSILRALAEDLERLTSKPFPSPKDEAAIEHGAARLTELFPKEPLSHYWRGVFLDRQGDSKGAAESFRASTEAPSKLLENEDDAVRARAWVRLGLDDLSRDELEEARAKASRAIALAPDSPAGYRLLLDAGLRDGRFTGAVEILRRAAKKSEALTPLLLESLASIGDWSGVESVLAAQKSPGSLDPLAMHYRARMADAKGAVGEAFVRHFLASRVGGVDQRTTWKSLEETRRLAAAPAPLPARLRPLAIAVDAADRRLGGREATEALAQFQPQGEFERLIAEHLAAEAAFATKQYDEAAVHWRGALAVAPEYAPALVGLGEALEAVGQDKEARALFSRARRIAPKCAKVDPLFRMGALVRPAKEGAEIVEVDPRGPYAELGLLPGDILLRLDEQDLARMPPADQVRAARVFQGGTVTYRTRDGEDVTLEMDLVLFPDGSSWRGD